MVLSMAARFGTGREPGCPRQTGHVCVFGGAPNSFTQPQNIFVAVESSTWHSRPMIVSKSSPMRTKRYRSHARASRNVQYSGTMARATGRSSTSTVGRQASSVLIWTALWAVYIVWGSTYLAIRVADRTLPPFLMAGVRFILAGAIMYGWAVWRGHIRYERPTVRDWLAATIGVGALCLGGNGLVVWAELHIDSGLAALIVATVPLWLALLDRLVFGQRLSAAAIFGLTLGFGGLAILVNPSGSNFSAAGVAAVVFAAFFWASGSLYSRAAPLHSRPFVATGMEMM